MFYVCKRRRYMVLDQVYCNTRVPTQLNTSQPESTQVNTSQQESDTSQHESTRV